MHKPERSCTNARSPRHALLCGNPHVADHALEKSICILRARSFDYRPMPGNDA